MASLLQGTEDNLDMPIESMIEDNNEAGTAAEGAAPSNPNNRRVYVGNLSWSTAWQGLKDHMKTVGEVIRADVLLDASGRSKGCGLVEFKTPAQARQAIATLNNTDLDGRQIFLREDREAGAASSGSAGGEEAQKLDPARQAQRVYVGNLSWNVDREQLRTHMGEVGEVSYCEVLTEPSGRSKGCGIVEYNSSEEAAAAIERLHNTTLNGRPIFVREDRESGAAGEGGGGGGGRGGGGGGHQQMYQQHHQQQQVVYHPHAAHHHVVHHPVVHHHAAPQQYPGGGPFPPTASAGGRGGGRGGGAQGGVGVRVYVGNLSYEVAWQDLKDHMRKVGNVVHADVLEDHEGRSKGCGIVEYDNPHGAMRAIRELNNTDLKGRLIFVREDREDKKLGGPVGGAGGGGFHASASTGGAPRGGGGGGAGGPPSAAGRQLYVGNLDFEITWQGLKDHFKGFDVQRAEVAYDADGRSRGFGTIRFGTVAEAQRAQEALNGTSLNNRTIEVREDNRVV